MNYKIITLIITLTIPFNANSFDFDVKKIKGAIDQAISEKISPVESVSDDTTKNDVSTKAIQSKIPPKSNQSDKNTSLSPYDPIQNFDVKDADSYCNKLVDSQIVKTIISYNKSTQKNFFEAEQNHASWAQLNGLHNQLGIYLWESIKIDAKDSMVQTKQINANYELIDNWLSICIAKNLDTDLHLFTGITKDIYTSKGKQQGVLLETKVVNSDGTITFKSSQDSGKYVKNLIPSLSSIDEFINADSSRIRSDTLVFLAFAIIKETDEFLSNSGKEYIAYINSETKRKNNVAKNLEMEKSNKEKISKEFMANPPKDPLANSCWVYSGSPNTEETKIWLDSLSKSEQMAIIYGGYQGSMWTFKSNNVAWYGKDMVKTANCTAKQNQLKGEINCPRSEWEYQFIRYDLFYTKGKNEPAWTGAYSRTDMCM